MRYFSIIFPVVMVLLHLYLFWNLKRARRTGRWQYLVLLPLVPFVWRRVMRRYVSEPAGMDMLTYGMYVWIGLVIMVCMWLAFRDILALGAWLADRRFGTGLFRRLGAGSIAAAMAIGVAAFAYSLHEARTPRIRAVRIETGRLPAGTDGVRLVLLSDLHLDSSTDPETVREIAAMTNAQKPDFVLLVGDVVDWRFSATGEMARALGGIEAKRGKFAVTGNHDVYAGLEPFAAFMDGSGFELLRGRFVDRGGIRVVGVDDPRTPGRRQARDVLLEAETDAFILLLSHTPEMAYDTEGRFDLELCGHTHGGQIWPFGIVVRLMHGVAQGLTRLPVPPGRPRTESLLYVTNGTRSWGPPIRFLTPPEITVIDLARERSIP